jgi:hypothetical protein
VTRAARFLTLALVAAIAAIAAYPVAAAEGDSVQIVEAGNTQFPHRGYVL